MVSSTTYCKPTSRRRCYKHLSSSSQAAIESEGSRIGHRRARRRALATADSLRWPSVMRPSLRPSTSTRRRSSPGQRHRTCTADAAHHLKRKWQGLGFVPYIVPNISKRIKGRRDPLHNDPEVITSKLWKGNSSGYRNPAPLLSASWNSIMQASTVLTVPLHDDPCHP